MFRKLTIALGATIAIAAAALVPTAASAGHHHHHHGHWGWYGGYGYAPIYAAAGDCYVVRRVVYTPYGKTWRRVRVCN